MTFQETLALCTIIFNVVIGAALFVGRLQLRVWQQDTMQSILGKLLEHNDDPAAHNNHAIAVSLELKFDQMMTRMSELTTQLAVLNERLNIKTSVSPYAPRTRK